MEESGEKQKKKGEKELKESEWLRGKKWRVERKCMMKRKKNEECQKKSMSGMEVDDEKIKNGD